MKKTLFILAIISLAQIASAEMTMYFFWGQGCSHCEQMKPSLAKLGEKYPQLGIIRMEVFRNQENYNLYEKIAEAYNTTARSVPMVFLGETYVRGYRSIETDKILEEIIINCSKTACKSPDEILLEYQNRPTTTTIHETTTTTTEPTTTTTQATSQTNPATKPIATTTADTTTTTSDVKTGSSDTADQTWLLIFPVGIALILVFFTATKKKKEKEEKKGM